MRQTTTPSLYENVDPDRCLARATKFGRMWHCLVSATGTYNASAVRGWDSENKTHGGLALVLRSVIGLDALREEHAGGNRCLARLSGARTPGPASVGRGAVPQAEAGETR